MNRRAVVVSSTEEPFTQTISVGLHTLLADEPENVGGSDAGPNPYEYLLAALGTCTSMTLLLYARRKNWPLEDVRVELSHSRVHRVDSEKCPREDRHLHRIDRQITLVGPLTDEQRGRLLAIAERCPVHRTLTGEIHIHSELVDAD